MSAPPHGHDPYAALRVPDFRRFSLFLMVQTLATMMQAVVVGWQLYQVTRDPLALGLVGLAEAVPFIACALPAGQLADRLDRRRVCLAAMIVLTGCATALWAITRADLLRADTTWMVYGIIFVSGIARSFLQPTRTALAADLVPRELYVNSITWRSSTWQFAAARAIAVNLSHSADRATAEGLVAISRLDYQSGCRRLREAALADSSDGRRWYSLATCLRLDPIVVRDRHSRTGWRFRSSYAEAVSDYRRAMVLLPAIHRGFRQGSFQRVRDILFTGSARSRGGRLVAGGPIVMAAMAEWQGDSLVFFPISLDQFSSAKTAVPKSNWDAIVRQRQLFRDLASSWLTAFPDSPAALEAVAVALDLMGDPAAPQLAARARLASRTAADSLRSGRRW